MLIIISHNIYLYIYMSNFWHNVINFISNSFCFICWFEKEFFVWKKKNLVFIDVGICLFVCLPNDFYWNECFKYVFERKYWYGLCEIVVIHTKKYEKWKKQQKQKVQIGKNKRDLEMGLFEKLSVEKKKIWWPTANV